MPKVIPDPFSFSLLDPFLLYTISQALAELDLDISVAKISTEKGAAIDSFYVSERDGGKVLGAERQREIERRLCAAIARLERS